MAQIKHWAAVLGLDAGWILHIGARLALGVQKREQTQKKFEHRVRSLHLPNSQSRPKYPGRHWQMVTFPSRQLPPLRHSQPSVSSAREGGISPCIAVPGQPHWGSSGPAARSPRAQLPGRQGPQLSPGALNELCRGSFSLGLHKHSSRASPARWHHNRDSGYSLSRQSCPA